MFFSLRISAHLQGFLGPSHSPAEGLATVHTVVSSSFCSWDFLKEVSITCLLLCPKQNKQNFPGNQISTAAPLSSLLFLHMIKEAKAVHVHLDRNSLHLDLTPCTPPPPPPRRQQILGACLTKVFKKSYASQLRSQDNVP